MNAGKLRHYVQLLSPQTSPQPDELGDMSSPPQCQGDAWAAIEPGTGREFWLAKQTRADITHTITMRFDPRIGPRWKVVWNDGYRVRTFELGPPLSPEERHFMMTFTAIEKWQ